MIFGVIFSGSQADSYLHGRHSLRRYVFTFEHRLLGGLLLDMGGILCGDVLTFEHAEAELLSVLLYLDCFYPCTYTAIHVRCQ